MRRFVKALVVALPIIAACSEREAPLSSTATDPLTKDPVAEVARSMALALQDATLRKSLADAMHGSPYVEQKLEFAAFRQTATGRALLQAAAASGPLNQVAPAIDQLPALELYVPVPEQRATWTGSPDILVLGTSLSDAGVKRIKLDALPAYDINGRLHWVSMHEVPTATLISLVPVETRFGQMPAAVPARTPGAAATVEFGWVMDELQMSQQPWVYDGVPFGEPEFEVWLARYLGNGDWGAPLDAQGQRPCASEEWVSSGPKFFNYDNPPSLFTNDFNFALGTRAQLNATYGSGGVGGYLFFTENDDTACPNSAEPSTDEFDNTDFGNDDELLGIFSLPASGDAFEWTNPNSNSDPVHWRVFFLPTPPPPPPPPPPPLGLDLDGPTLISVKGTYTYTAVDSNFTNPSFIWQERFCDDAANTSCMTWVTITGLGDTFNRTLGPDCSTPEKNFQLRVTETNSDGRSLTAEKTTQLCQAP